MTSTKANVPTRFSAAVFRGKATLLQIRRAAWDVARGIRRYPLTDPLAEAEDYPVVLAESRTPLWGESGDVEWRLQAGKVQNLRCALRRLNGALIPADGTFSFWKQIGQATRRRGYVEGRLLREGCLIPAVGGGLCQLSNALYDVALQAGLEIVERWGHSRIVPGSAAAAGRDATVAWNYIDLRFRPRQAVLIEARLTADELIVRLLSRDSALSHESAPRPEPFAFIPLAAIGKARPHLDATAHSCATCGASACYRHEVKRPVSPQARTAFLLDECWPEFQDYVAQNHAPRDVMAIPLDGVRWKQPRYAWPTSGFARLHTATVPTLARSLATRRLARQGAARLRAQLRGAAALAEHLARALTPEVTHVVVAQSLLPFLWRGGHLGGRTVEVLMTRWPLRVLHEQLDAAAARHPDRLTLCEFRAPHWLVEAEEAALGDALIVTPHGAIAALFAERARLLAWHQPRPGRPAAHREANTRPAIAFPGPTAARKGAYEVRAAACALGWEVVLPGSEFGSGLEGDDFWQDVPTRRVPASRATEDWLCGVLAVVQPALMEEQPRRLLAALSAGVPVVATPACGLAEQTGVILVPEGDEAALCVALLQLLESRRA